MQAGPLKILVLFLAVIALGWCNGCEKRQDAQPTQAQQQKDAAVLNIGIIPEQNLFAQKKRYQPLADYLGRKSGVTIQLKILSRYGNIINNFVSMDLDGAFFGSFTGALALKRLNVEPLVRPEAVDGHSTYLGLIFVRKDSAIENGADMKGKRFAFVDKATTAGWLLPLFYFKEQGISDYKTWFQESYFAGTHEDAILDVIEKRADIGAAKNTVFYRLAVSDARVVGELEILARSPFVPENALMLRKDLDASLREKIYKVLLGMEQDVEGRELLKEFGARRFIATSVEDYTPVLDYAKRVGLDLATYDYLND